MTAAQLSLDLPMRTAQGRGDFFVAPPNAAALARLEAWQSWPGAKLVLVGPEGAGKSHLARIWAEQAGATVIDAAALGAEEPAPHAPLAVEDCDEAVAAPAVAEALFHLHEAAARDRAPLLLTARRQPALWPCPLADLTSRMQGAEAVVLDAPDDALLSAVLVKLFADRQITVAPPLIDYLVRRMERSFAAAGRLVTALDAHALASGRRITPALAAEVLAPRAAEGE